MHRPPRLMALRRQHRLRHAAGSQTEIRPTDDQQPSAARTIEPTASPRRCVSSPSQAGPRLPPNGRANPAKAKARFSDKFCAVGQIFLPACLAFLRLDIYGYPGSEESKLKKSRKEKSKPNRSTRLDDPGCGPGFESRSVNEQRSKSSASSPGTPTFPFSPPGLETALASTPWPLSSSAHLHPSRCLYPLVGQLSLGCIADAISLQPRPHATTCIAASWNDGARF